MCGHERMKLEKHAKAIPFLPGMSWLNFLVTKLRTIILCFLYITYISCHHHTWITIVLQTNTTITISIIQFFTMPIRFREPAQRPGFLHRQRPLHAVLGGGKRKIFFFIKILRKMLTFITFTFLMQQILSLIKAPFLIAHAQIYIFPNKFHRKSLDYDLRIKFVPIFTPQK